jgi:hypothetical protein
MRNTLATGAYQIAAMLLGFVTPRLMMAYYGSDINGLVASITEFIGYFKLVEAGLAAAAIYGLYKPLSENDHDQISAIVSAARQFYQKSGFLFIALTLVFSAIYPFVIPITSLSRLSVGLLAAIMGLSGTLEFFTLSRYRVLLTADQKTFVVSWASMASLVLQTAVIVGLSLIRADILLLRLLAGLTILLRSVLLYAYVRRHYPYVNYKAKPDKAPLSRRWDALYQQLTVTLHQGMGIILTTVITRDALLVSVYSTYHLVTVGLWGILKMVSTGLYASFGDLLARNEMDKFRRAYREYEFLFLSVITVLYSVSMALIIPFVRLYTRGIADVNYVVPILGVLLTLEGLTDQIKAPLDLMVTAAGKFRETRHHNTLQVCLGFGLGLILGIFFGLPGIAAGILLSNLTRVGIQLWFVPKHITGLPFRETLTRMVRLILTGALICVPFLIWPLMPSRFVVWIGYAVLLTIYAALVTALMGWLFDRQQMRAVWKRISGMTRKAVGQ